MLWKDRLGIRYYILLKAARFGIMTFEFVTLPLGYPWNFIVYSSAGTDVIPGIDMPDQLRSSEIVVKLSEPLMNKGHTLWKGSYYNSPSFVCC
jgi:hypothetical protein